VQYGLGALNRGEITAADFLDFNAQVGGFDGDGYPQVARHVGDPEALRVTYEAGFVNGFNGQGLANVPIITQRANASNVGDIHDTMQDLIIRARLQRANGRADNQVIWTSSGEAAGRLRPRIDFARRDQRLARQHRADPAPASKRQGGSQQAGAGKRCVLDKSGNRIVEPARPTRRTPAT